MRAEQIDPEVAHAHESGIVHRDISHDNIVRPTVTGLFGKFWRYKNSFNIGARCLIFRVFWLAVEVVLVIEIRTIPNVFFCRGANEGIAKGTDEKTRTSLFTAQSSTLNRKHIFLDPSLAPIYTCLKDYTAKNQ